MGDQKPRTDSELKKLYDVLKPYNPWWFDRNWYSSDQLIVEYETSEYKLLSRLYYHIKKNIVIRGRYGVITLRGPRRSGKTTIVKLLIKYLLTETKVDPYSVFYISLDYEGLRDINLVNVLTLIANCSQGEKYVFIDEASMYADWALALKNIYDMGLVNTGKMKILVTGSHSMDLDDVVNKLKGRQGSLAEIFNLGGNLLHVPLRFPEFIEAVIREVNKYMENWRLRRPKKRFEILKHLREGIIDEHIKHMYNNYFGLIQSYFENYLLHGGYPRSITEFYRHGLISSNLYSSVAQLLISDAGKANLNVNILKRVLMNLVDPQRLSGLISFKDSDLGKITGKQELENYLEYLRTTWTFLFPYREMGKSSSCIPNYEEPRKNYVLDPLVYYALHSHLNNIPNPFKRSREFLQDTGFKGRIVESIIASHLILSQQFFEHISSVDYNRVLMYRRENGEADFVLCITKGGELYRFVIESKYRSSSFDTSKELGKIVLTKDTLDTRNGMIYIPVSIFLLLF